MRDVFGAAASGSARRVFLVRGRQRGPPIILTEQAIEPRLHLFATYLAAESAKRTKCVLQQPCRPVGFVLSSGTRRKSALRRCIDDFPQKLAVSSRAQSALSAKLGRGSCVAPRRSPPARGPRFPPRRWAGLPAMGPRGPNDPAIGPSRGDRMTRRVHVC